MNGWRSLKLRAPCLFAGDPQVWGRFRQADITLIHSGTHTFPLTAEKAVDHLACYRRSIRQGCVNANQWPGWAFFIAAICSGLAAP
jgi:hypothetical protein